MNVRMSENSGARMGETNLSARVGEQNQEIGW